MFGFDGPVGLEYNWAIGGTTCTREVGFTGAGCISTGDDTMGYVMA